MTPLLLFLVQKVADRVIMANPHVTGSEIVFELQGRTFSLMFTPNGSWGLYECVEYGHNLLKARPCSLDLNTYSGALRLLSEALEGVL